MQITCNLRLLPQEIALLVQVLSSVVQLVFLWGLGEASSGAGPDLRQLLEIAVKSLSSSPELLGMQIVTCLLLTNPLSKQSE